MKKVVLDPEALRVESFAVEAAEALRGTVDAMAATGHTCVIETRCAARSCVSFAPTCIPD